MKTYRCNMCGKSYRLDPKREHHFTCSHEFGYGSRIDGDRLDLDICPKCEDEFADKVIAMCKVSPMSANLYDDE